MGRKTKEELQREVQIYHINRSGIALRQFKLALVEHNLLTDVESTIKTCSSKRKSRGNTRLQFEQRIVE